MAVDLDRRAMPVYLLITWVASSPFYFLIIKSAGPMPPTCLIPLGCASVTYSIVGIAA